MVNVYIFYVDSSTPSGFTEIDASYRDRLIKLGGTALQTGGSATHTHTGVVESYNFDYSGTQKNISWGGNAFASAAGSHGHTEKINSISSASSFPAYTKIRLMYRNVVGWDGSVPSGGVICKENSASGWSDLGYTNFAYITNAYGTSISQATHSHDVCVSLNALSAGDGLQSKSGTSFAYRGHGHLASSISLTSSVIYDYYYAAIRFIKTSSTQYIMKDGICLFDGNPGDRWTLIDAYNDRFLKFGTGSWSTGGSYYSYNHSHSGSGKSGEADSTKYFVAQTSDTNYLPIPVSAYHEHNLDISLDSTSAEPAWVRLIPYRSNVDFPIKSSPQPLLCNNILSAI